MILQTFVNSSQKRTSVFEFIPITLKLTILLRMLWCLPKCPTSFFFDIMIIVTSCYRFSCYYRFSDIAINSVNPSFIRRLEFSKNGQLNISLYIRLFLKPFLYFNILSIIWQLLLSVKWCHLFSCEVKTRPIYGMETNIQSGNGWF